MSGVESPHANNFPAGEVVAGEELEGIVSDE